MLVFVGERNQTYNTSPPVTIRTLPSADISLYVTVWYTTVLQEQIGTWLFQYALNLLSR